MFSIKLAEVIKDEDWGHPLIGNGVQMYYSRKLNPTKVKVFIKSQP